jgi:hypothetical protein
MSRGLVICTGEDLPPVTFMRDSGEGLGPQRPHLAQVAPAQALRRFRILNFRVRELLPLFNAPKQRNIHADPDYSVFGRVKGDADKFVERVARVVVKLFQLVRLRDPKLILQHELEDRGF